MSQNNTSLHWIALGPDLIQCLKSGGNHRLNRYEAFIWLVERIQKGTTRFNDIGEAVSCSPYSVSYKRLAEEWKWERHAVQSFVSDLVGLSAIKAVRDGNSTVFLLGEKSHDILIL